jgi:hypothetical protein
MTVSVRLSGTVVQSEPESKRVQSVSVLRTIEFPDVGPGYFDVRVSQNGVNVPATMRFSNGFSLLDIKYDTDVAGAPDMEKVKAAVNPLLAKLQETRSVYGKWKVGETRAIEFQFPNPVGSGVAIKGTTRLRRIVLVGGRAACEFQFEGTGDMKMQSGPIRMIMKGQEFRDIGTGLPIGQAGTGHADVSLQGKSFRVEIETEEVLDGEQSRF